jgi:hypothetical protein
VGAVREVQALPLINYKTTLEIGTHNIVSIVPTGTENCCSNEFTTPGRSALGVKNLFGLARGLDIGDTLITRPGNVPCLPFCAVSCGRHRL